MKEAKQKKDAPPRLLTNGPPCEPTHDEIVFRAFSLRGRTQNQEVEIWLQAETQLRQPQHEHGVRA